MDAYTTGRGSIRMRAVAEIEEGKNGDRIVVTRDAVPDLRRGHRRKIADLVNNREIDGIRGLRNESAKGETKLVIELKRDANPHVMLNQLYKHTPMQTNFGVNMLALVDGVPRTLNLADALRGYVDHQVDVVTRRTEYRLRKAKERDHIVEGLVRALDVIDEIIALIRASADTDTRAPGPDGEAVRVLARSRRTTSWTCRCAASRSSSSRS